MEISVVKVLGYEWCRPLPDARLVDYITIGADGGHIALCRVEQDEETGKVNRVMLRREDLNDATDAVIDSFRG